MPTHEWTRREVLTAAGRGLVAAGLAAESATAADAQSAPPQQPTPPPAPQPPAMSPVQAPISLPPFEAPTERQSGPPPLPLPPEQRVGFAIVGLGNLALSQVLPAFGECRYARPTALVSGDPAKANEVARQHGIPARSVYSYQTFDTLRDNPDVQVVYIILPNALHAEYAVRGAQAGKHILSEKPMATSPQECQTMIDACRKANVKLMVAYRIQYEPNNRFVRNLVQTQQYGPVKLIESVNGQVQGDPNQWRQKKALAGGGSLPDVGLYCLNTTRFLLGEEPEEVFAQTYSTPGDPRFREVEENVIWQMRFPSGVLSNSATGYGFHESRRYRVHAVTGWYGLDPAFSYSGLRMDLSYASYARGPVEFRQTPQIEQKNQFALEMDHMAQCVLQDRTPYTPGEEGLQDHRLMAAIYESARTGKPVKLPRVDKRDAFRGTEPA